MMGKLPSSWVGDWESAGTTSMLPLERTAPGTPAVVKHGNVPPPIVMPAPPPLITPLPTSLHHSHNNPPPNLAPTRNCERSFKRHSHLRKQSLENQSMPGMAPAAWYRSAVKMERGDSTERKQRIRKDMEDRDIDLNVPYVEEDQEQEFMSASGSASAASSTSASDHHVKSSSGRASSSDEVHYRGSSEEATYRGVRHRPELNKWVTEIRPTAQKRKIWLGTYKTPEEAARAYDVGIHYTGKKIPLNFPDSMPNLPELPRGTWEEIAPFVKKQAVSAAKRHRGF